MHPFTLALSLTLVALAWLSFFAQVRQVRRSGAAGVSLSSWTSMTVTRLVLLVFAHLTHDPFVLATALGTLVASVLIMRACWPVAAAASRRRALVALGATVVAGVGAVAGDATLLVDAAMYAMVVLSAVPQLVAAVREDDLSGVSLTTWASNTAASGGWILYAVLTHNPTLGGTNVIWVLCSVGIVAATLVRRPRTATAVVPQPAA